MVPHQRMLCRLTGLIHEAFVCSYWCLNSFLFSTVKQNTNNQLKKKGIQLTEADELHLLIYNQSCKHGCFLERQRWRDTQLMFNSSHFSWWCILFMIFVTSAS